MVNVEIDCKDGSDEDPSYLVTVPCADGFTRCKNGKCIHYWSWCTGYVTCGDGSNEGEHCLDYECPPDYWKCWDNTQCIENKRVCDRESNMKKLEIRWYGRYQKDKDFSAECHDRSDEHNVLCGCPASRSWPCKDGFGCIHYSEVCNGVADCNNGTDETPSTCANHTCMIGHVKCKDKDRPCEPRCDGVIDCLDKSDETNCELFHCIPGRRKCADNRQCINETGICDGNVECRDLSDELCKAKCLPKHLGVKELIGKRCPENNDICFPIEKFCDGVTDCPLGSDEAQSDCTCQQWGLHECKLDGHLMCTYNEWLKGNSIMRQICQNSDIQVNDKRWGEDQGMLVTFYKCNE